MRGKHEGSYWVEGNRWRGVLQFEGKKYKVSGKTKAEARRKINELLQKLEGGTAVKGGAIKLQDFLDMWIDSARNQLAVRTVESYEQVVRDYLKPPFGASPARKAAC